MNDCPSDGARLCNVATYEFEYEGDTYSNDADHCIDIELDIVDQEEPRFEKTAELSGSTIYYELSGELTDLLPETFILSDILSGQNVVLDTGSVAVTAGDITVDYV